MVRCAFLLITSHVRNTYKSFIQRFPRSTGLLQKKHAIRVTNVINDIKRACATFGAFVLINHGVPKTLLDDVLITGHAFFDLPAETKQKYDLHKYGAKCRVDAPLGGVGSMWERHLITKRVCT